MKGTSTVKGLLHYIHKYIDPNQFAVKGSSCTHALIKIINFIMKNTDTSNTPRAVLNLLADWHKAFNKINHNIVVKILISMQVPEWIQRLVVSYLEKRKMHVRFRDVTSKNREMPGGAPQGTLLGGILYILCINPIGFPAELLTHPEIASILNEENWKKSLDTGNHLQPIQPSHPILSEDMNSAKYMGDATIQEKVDLNTTLCSNFDRSGPLPFHESSGKILPGVNSKLQKEIENIKKISDDREMLLNKKKTVLLISNFTDNHQFRPMLTIPGENDPIKVVQETKLLGYWITADLKPKKHVTHIIQKAMKRIWIIRRLKMAKCHKSDLIHIYKSIIRSILETDCPVFHSQLTLENSDNMERIQKIVLRIVLGAQYLGYDDACLKLNLESLKARRENLCLKFALKCLTNTNHSNLFVKNLGTSHATRNKLTFLEPICHSSRYQNSPVPYLTTLLNKYFEENPSKVFYYFPSKNNITT